MDASHLILSLTSEYVYVYVVHGEMGAHREMERAVRGLVLVSNNVVHLFWVWIGCEQIRQRICAFLHLLFSFRDISKNIYYFPLGKRVPGALFDLILEFLWVQEK